MNPDSKKHFVDLKAGLNNQIADLEKREAMLNIELSAHREHLKAIEDIIAKFDIPQPKTTSPPTKKT